MNRHDLSPFVHTRCSLRPRFLMIGALVVLAAVCCQGGNDQGLTWWNIGKFLRQFVNTGLGAFELQKQVSTSYRWHNQEVDGHQRLQEINQRASRFFQKNIEVVKALKEVIEKEYDNWQGISPDQINISRDCCRAEQPSSSGCSTWARRGRPQKLLALEPPSAVLWEMERLGRQHSHGITRYFAFTDGSVFMHPPPRKQTLLACDNYDPRLRYFFTQSKSPEPRDVVVVVDAPGGANLLLEKVVVRTFSALSPLDRVGLCLPHGDQCRTRPLGQQATMTATWPGQEQPLGRQSFLGHVVVSTEGNNDRLSKLLDKWLKSSAASAERFSSHSVAVKAGLQFLNSTFKQPFDQTSRQQHRVLVYVTTRGDWYRWREEPRLLDTLVESLQHNTSVVIHPIYEAAANVDDELLMEERNSTVKLVPFPTLDKFYSSQTSIISYGLTDKERTVIPMPYWDAFGAGYIISVCQPLMVNGQFVGTACTDDSIVNLLSDTAIDDVEKAYVFIVNSMGNTLMHPMLPSPHSLTEEPYFVTIDRLERHNLNQSTLEQIVRQQPGSEDVKGIQVQSVGRPRGPSLPNTVRLTQAKLRYLWAPINFTDLTIGLVLPLHQEKVMSSVYKCFNSTTCQIEDFQYHLPKSGDKRKLCRFFGTEALKNKGLVKFAPDCFIDVLSYVNGEENRDIAKLYSIIDGSNPYDELLRKDLRASVKLMETAEKIWQQALNLSDYIGVQFMGTADGTFISYPGTEFKQTFDHRSKPWYQQAVSTVESESILMTTPYCEEWGAGMMYTIAKPLHGPLNNLVAVVAGDFTLQYIVAHFNKQMPYCTLHTCFLVDRTGYVVLKSDWIHRKTTPRSCANNTEIIAAHLNLLAPDIARDMIANKILQRQGCHDYERDVTFYYWSLSLSGYRTYYKGASYIMHKIPFTNLFLVVRTESLMQDSCHCDPHLNKALLECHDTCLLKCECPCVARSNTQPCHDPSSDIHRLPLPSCKPRGLTLVSAKNYTEQQLSRIPPCNDNKCDFQNETDCNNVVVCLWLNNECRNVDTL